ncbi:MAG: ATP-dependent metallopeptidase FtsH/Yme1/Tma family protein [Rhodospirillales bacterium]|nr:ATP-dependent metallopeptidase FtsH/Yme1/Tma family protein [Rhodospirillales bacterium]
MDKQKQINLWYVLIAVAGIMLLQNLWTQGGHVEVVPYSQFQAYLEQGNVAEIVVTENQIRGRFKEPLASGAKHFVTMRVDPALLQDLSKYGVTITGSSSAASPSSRASAAVSCRSARAAPRFTSKPTPR